MIEEAVKEVTALLIVLLAFCILALVTVYKSWKKNKENGE